MSSVFDAATAAPVKASSGPTQYRPIREPLTDAATAQRLQLAARVGDQEPFVLACKSDAIAGKTAPVDALNASNVERHTLRAELAQLPAEDERDDAQTQRAAAIAAEIKALPRIDALRSAPVARALMLYSAADDAAAPADAPAGE